MTITAIIPTYQRPHMLTRAVRSVLCQSYPQFEILIADNASGIATDITTDQLLKKDPRIKLLKQASNIGPTANFQAALMHVTTPYVCFLPDDDFFSPFFFEETIPLFSQYPDIAFCGGGGVNIDEHYIISQILHRPPSGYYPAPSGLFAYLRSSCGIAFPPLLFKTAILKELGGFDMRIRNGMDEHLVSQCAARHPIYLITDRIFYFGYQHGGSLSKQIDYALFFREAQLTHENISSIPLAPEHKYEIDLFFTQRKHKILSSGYNHCCKLGAFIEAKRYAETLYALTKASDWKRKKIQAVLYHYAPFLASCYHQLKVYEKSLRYLKKKKTEIPPPDHSHPDALFWQEYARNLDID